MANEKVFEATKKVYGLYGAFFKVVAQELGWAFGDVHWIIGLQRNNMMLHG